MLSLTRKQRYRLFICLWDVFIPDDGRTKPVPRKGHSESFEPADNKCLIRASDGKKKISTVVGLCCTFCGVAKTEILWVFVIRVQSFLYDFAIFFSGHHQRSNQVPDGMLTFFLSVLHCRNIFLFGPVVVILTLSSQAYSNLLRAHMDGLKKKDKKSKSKKTKATQ